ncbi:3-hydroxyacyl-CoA dehydrogenase family protein [Allokutzneria multivorans]|uniref:3-hydroxyacyl-CoA dehydrogenase family protein n=1 Tax=Allokutzneria multivorans TaxID=1142134 RepID=A0ABP7SLD2_9PSEU
MPPALPIAVVGAGTLGRRLALVFATGGAEVRITDPVPEHAAQAVEFVSAHAPDALGQVVAVESVKAAVDDAWLVVEAVPERLDLKREVFAELDALTDHDVVLASNSSSIPTSRLIDGLDFPERVLNTHFYLPPIVNAVEVMSSGRTSRAVMDSVVGALGEFGFTPVEVRAESTGFIYNRIWAAVKREALAVVAEGVATPAEVDLLYRAVVGVPAGPFRVMDQVGLDVALDIENTYAAERQGLPEGPRVLLREYVDRGALGVKSGRGFYDDYREES